MLKLPRTLRLDDSDLHVYERAAAPGEWAVPGSFAFLDVEPADLHGKGLQAFRTGFLGTASFGWSTVVEVAEIDLDEFQSVIDRLAAHLIAACGAPHIAAALPAAGDEVNYASQICSHPVNTLLAIERDFGADGILESLKVVRPNAADHASVKLWGPDPGQDG